MINFFLINLSFPVFTQWHEYLSIPHFLYLFWYKDLLFLYFSSTFLNLGFFFNSQISTWQQSWGRLFWRGTKSWRILCSRCTSLMRSRCMRSRYKYWGLPSSFKTWMILFRLQQTGCKIVNVKIHKKHLAERSFFILTYLCKRYQLFSTEHNKTIKHKSLQTAWWLLTSFILLNPINKTRDL